MSDSETRLAQLPQPVRNRLNAMPLTILIESIEEVNNLRDNMYWAELKARIAQLSRLVPRGS